MVRFDQSGEGRNRFLRNLHRSPLRQRAFDVLGEEGPRLLAEMKEAHPEDFDEWARNILRKCARLDSKRRRHRYIAGCISRHRRIEELSKWQVDNPDPHDVLDLDEIRMIGRDESRAYYAKAVRVEYELVALSEGRGGYSLLIERMGAERAWKMATRLMAFIDADRCADQINTILTCAARETIRYPERYIAKVIENERGE